MGQDELGCSSGTERWPSMCKARGPSPALQREKEVQKSGQSQGKRKVKKGSNRRREKIKIQDGREEKQKGQETAGECSLE